MDNISFLKSSFIRIVAGHILIILSGVFYSVYWILQYYRQNSKPFIFSPLLIIISLILGISGALLLAFSLNDISGQITHQFKIRHILLLTTGFFIISFFITSFVFHRQFTSEIFFIVLWAGIEISCIYAFFNLHWFSLPQFIVSLVLAFICLSVSMVCYTIHYTLPERERFINGLIPYIVVSLYMLINMIILITNKPHLKYT